MDFLKITKGGPLGRQGVDSFYSISSLRGSSSSSYFDFQSSIGKITDATQDTLHDLLQILAKLLAKTFQESIETLEQKKTGIKQKHTVGSLSSEKNLIFLCFFEIEISQLQGAS